MSYPARAEGLGKYDIYIYIYINEDNQINKVNHASGVGNKNSRTFFLGNQ